ncbi:YezD family protein [Lederbergia sp. NSJ-179]|nr:YezD family protein [Lederbergia sp. NSJ-179]MCJ7841198.1 YezD family protein [Lederbergia sp. NSJ-179]
MSNQKKNLEQAIETVKGHLSTMKYGSITLIVQDQHVVQIEKNEKIRLK